MLPFVPDTYLANSEHDWHSVPFSQFGWRVSGRRRAPGGLTRNPHAGFDFLTYFCNYLEPVLGFCLEGVRPGLRQLQWTPSRVAAEYGHGALALRLEATLCGNEGGLIRATVRNEGKMPVRAVLGAYSEGERHLDPEDVTDQGQGGYGKDILHATQRRLSAGSVWLEATAQIAQSHRGGVFRYDRITPLKWFHTWLRSGLYVALPPGGRAADDAQGWRQEWLLDLAPGAAVSLGFAIAIAYRPGAPLDEPVVAALQRQARRLAEQDFDAVVAAHGRAWTERLAAVEPPPPELPEALKQIYYRAWVCTWQLVTGRLDTGRRDGLVFPDACVLVTKADHRAVMPAEFETALGAWVLSQVDPALARQVLDCVNLATEIDGYVPENLVFTKNNMLGYLTSYVAWTIYLQQRDPAWLASGYDAMKRSLLCHYRHPSFCRHDRPFFRNLVYVHIGYLYLHKIAVELNQPQREVQELAELADETLQVVQSFWDPAKEHFADHFATVGPAEQIGRSGSSSVQSLLALFAGADEAQAACLLRDLRRRFLVGGFFPTEDEQQPDLSKAGAYKISNYLFFLPGLARHDPELCRELALRSLQGLAHNGDFHEQMTVDGGRRAFGPMSIFGAFGAIVCTQMLARLGLPAAARTEEARP